jgi:hypothetical protein
VKKKLRAEDAAPYRVVVDAANWSRQHRDPAAACREYDARVAMEYSGVALEAWDGSTWRPMFASEAL